MAGLQNVELINSEWNSYMVSFETYSEWGMDDPLNASSTAGAMIYMQESTIGKFFRYAFDNYWFGMVNWYDQWRYSGLSMRALRQVMDNGNRLLTTGSDTLGTAIIASGSSSNDEMQLVVTNNISSAHGYTISFQGLDQNYIYPYQIYRIDSSHKYFLAETGAISQLSNEITQPVHAPYTDHILFDKLLAINDPDLSSDGMIFPNPCSRNFSFSGNISSGNHLKVEICDVSGRIIRKWEMDRPVQNQFFSVEGISPSVYYVKVCSLNHEQKVYKLVIK